jgi:hypothetical protein
MLPVCRCVIDQKFCAWRQFARGFWLKNTQSHGDRFAKANSSDNKRETPEKVNRTIYSRTRFHVALCALQQRPSSNVEKYSVEFALSMNIGSPRMPTRPASVQFLQQTHCICNPVKRCTVPANKWMPRLDVMSREDAEVRGRYLPVLTDRDQPYESVPRGESQWHGG